MSAPLRRVLSLTNELSFRGSSILTLRIARELERRGVETVTLCTKLGSLDLELSRGLKIFELQGYTLPLWWRVVGRTVLSQLTPQPPEVIHVHGVSMLPQGLWLANALDRPIVLSVVDQVEATRIPMLPHLERVNAIICVSESVRAAIPPHPRMERIEKRVILPGVCLPELPKHNPILPEYRAPVIGMAGPLEILKGGSFFLRACHRVIENGHNIRIVITGSGPEERNLRRLATSLELTDQVTFVDDGAEMQAYLTAIDIFCLPSLQQGLGVMMLEAMALGRPVVASGVGGILSVISDDLTGLIVPPSDSRSIADHILQLLADPERARLLGDAGRLLVETHFSIERVVEEITALYAEVRADDEPVATAGIISGPAGSVE